MTIHSTQTATEVNGHKVEKNNLYLESGSVCGSREGGENESAIEAESIGLARVRLQLLTPFIDTDGLTKAWPDIEGRVQCTLRFAYKLLARLKKNGSQNTCPSMMLRQMPGVKPGQSRLESSVEKQLQDATRKVCVDEMAKPGSRRATDKIIDYLRQAGCTQIPSRKLISSRTHASWVTDERTTPYQRDHLARVAGERKPEDGLMEVCVGDVTQFSNDDFDLRVYQEISPGILTDLGTANAYFFILSSNKAIWSAYPFCGPQNRRLTSVAIHRGLTSKGSLLKSLGIDGHWTYHGMVGRFHHDNGKEFVANDVKETLKDIGIPVVDRSPPNTPHFKGGIERLNRTAHQLFRTFLESAEGKKYIFKDPKDPKRLCILWKDFEKALIEWVIAYNDRPHRALGGKSPNQALDDFAIGRNGHPMSGVPAPVLDTQALQYDFLCREDRTVKHTGIHIGHRCYRSEELECFFGRDPKTNERTRSSEYRSVSVRYDPYHMGRVMVEHPDSNPRMPADARKFIYVPFMCDSNQRCYDRALFNRFTDCTLWEWQSGFKLLRQTYLNGEATISKDQAEKQLLHQIANAKNVSKAGAPSMKGRMRASQEDTMRTATAPAIDQLFKPEPKVAIPNDLPVPSAAKTVQRPKPINTKIDLESLHGNRR